LRLQLVGRFAAFDDGDEPITVTPTGARLLALLALHRHGLTRGCVGGMLWPEKNEERATANLRSALWRLKTTRSIAIVDREPAVMCLSPEVRVDLDEICRGHAGDGVAVDRLLCDLLIGWDDPWVWPFRLRWRQTRLHAVDDRCREFVEGHAYDDAVLLARRVLAEEPLRESMLRLLVRAEMERQQTASAVHAIDDYRVRLQRELGAQVSPRMVELASALTDDIDGTLRIA